MAAWSGAGSAADVSPGNVTYMAAASTQEAVRISEMQSGLHHIWDMERVGGG